MSYEFKKLSDVDRLEQLSDSTTIMGFENGKPVQFSSNKVGSVKTVNGAAPDESGNIALEMASSWDDLEGKPFYDTRETFVTEPVTLTAPVVEWGYIKVADDVDFNVDTVTHMTRITSVEGSPEYNNVPVYINKHYGYTGFVTEDGSFLATYFANQSEANKVWDGSDNPFTSGLYVLAGNNVNNGDEVTVTYNFTYKKGELKPIDTKYLPKKVPIECLPEGVPYCTQKVEKIKIEWDGNTDGLVRDNDDWGVYKVSDLTPDFDELKSATVTMFVGGQEMVLADLFSKGDDDEYFGVGGYAFLYDDGDLLPCVVIKNPNNYFPEAGLYFAYFDNGNVITTSMTYTGITGKLNTIDPQCLPEGYPYSKTEAIVDFELNYDDCDYHSDDGWEHGIPDGFTSFLPVVGNEYTVTIDGKVFNTACTFTYDGYVGNQWFLGNGNTYNGSMSDTGEPFVITLLERDNSSNSVVRLNTEVFPNGEFTSITVSHNVQVVQPMDKKFLPEGMVCASESLVEVLRLTENYSEELRNTEFMPILMGKYVVEINGVAYPTTCRAIRGYSGNYLNLGKSFQNSQGMGDDVPFGISFPAWETDYEKPQLSVEYPLSYDDIQSVVIYHSTFADTVDYRLMPDGYPREEEKFVSLAVGNSVYLSNGNRVNNYVEFIFEVGETYIIAWDGKEYTCVAKEAPVDGYSKVVAVGNTDGNSNEPFAIGTAFNEAGEPTSTIFGAPGESRTIYYDIIGIEKAVTPIDPKYLPNPADLPAEWIAALKTVLGI